jgi:hypothetical protein
VKSYLLDEISSADVEKIENYLKNHATTSNLGGLFWQQVPDDLLSQAQTEHRDCRPHVFAVEVGPDSVRFELLVRSLTTMRCPCAGYCTDAQTGYVIRFADTMLEKLGIRT